MVIDAVADLDTSWGTLAGLALFALYHPLSLIAFDGQTLGKKATGARVVRSDGNRIGAGTAFTREFLGRTALLFVPFYGIADVITCLASGHKRALHDMVGGTIVIEA